ncbi:MAG: hypothetical protein HC798_03025 [Polaribacter sp.]|nr:hypothetical protein [Polaribacter sp.]
MENIIIALTPDITYIIDSIMSAQFAAIVGFTYFICEEIFKRYGKLMTGEKKMFTATLIGGGTGLLICGFNINGLIIGLLVGRATTLGVSNVRDGVKLFKQITGKVQEIKSLKK